MSHATTIDSQSQSEPQSEPLATLDLGPLDQGLLTIPYLENWIGLWAIHEPAAQELLRGIGRLNLASHLAQRRIADPVQAAPTTAPYAVDPNGIVTLRIDGTMLKHQSSFGMGASTVLLRRTLRQALADPAVKGVLLVFDTPGGAVAGTYDLAEEVFAATKPIHAYAEDLCASAGYVVASQADRISGNSSVSVGSIGTYLRVVDYSQAYAEAKVKVHVIRSSELKGTGVPGAPITEAQLADLTRYCTDMNQLFLDAVERGRKLSSQQVETLADGRVHIGQNCVQLGLIDAVETIDQAYQNLVSTLRGKAMSTTQQTVEQPTSTPAAATLAELKAACPGAGNDFLVSQLENGATVSQASTAWMKAQAEENTRLKAELETARQTASQNNAPPKPGNQPLSMRAGDGTAELADPIGAWETGVSELMARGLTKEKAVQTLVRKEPELHRAYVTAYTQQQKARR